MPKHGPKPEHGFLLPDRATILIKETFPHLDESQLPSGPRRLGGEQLGCPWLRHPAQPCQVLETRLGPLEAQQPVPQAVGSRVRVGTGIHSKEHDGTAFAKDR